MSINKVILVGNVGKSPEVRQLQDGSKIASFSLATSESWKDKNTGEKKDKTEWHNIVVYHKGIVSVVEQYVQKGSKLYIEGQLQTRKWTDTQGVEKYKTEITLTGYNSILQLLGNVEKQESVREMVSNARARHQAEKADGYAPDSSYERDDDIPF